MISSQDKQGSAVAGQTHEVVDQLMGKAGNVAHQAIGAVDQAADAVGQAAGTVHAAASHIGEKVGESLARGRDKARAATISVGRAASHRPLAAIGIAAGVGLLIGYAWGRK